MINQIKLIIISIATVLGIYSPAPISKIIEIPKQQETLIEHKSKTEIGTRTNKAKNTDKNNSEVVELRKEVESLKKRLDDNKITEKKAQPVEVYYPSPKIKSKFNITSDEFLSKTRVVSTSTNGILFITDLTATTSFSWTSNQKVIDLNDYLLGYDSPLVNIDWVCTNPPDNPNAYDPYHPERFSQAFKTCVLWVEINGEKLKFKDNFNLY